MPTSRAFSPAYLLNLITWRLIPPESWISNEKYIFYSSL